MLSLRIKREVGPSFLSSRAFLRPILELSGSASAHRRHLEKNGKRNFQIVQYVLETVLHIKSWYIRFHTSEAKGAKGD